VAANQEPEDFEALCETLARRQHLVRAAGAQQFPDGCVSQRYEFVHALYRDVCYGRQAPGRRAMLHRRLGERMEGVFATRLSDVASELAHHFAAGAAWARAVTYLRLVADTAERRYAHREAATTLQHALALVHHLPEAPERTQHALTLYIALGTALRTAKGHAAPEVEHAYTQARALCQQVGETPELVPVLFGLWRFYLVRSQLHTAQELGETLLRLAHQAHDPALAVIVHYALGATWMWLGALPAARQHMEEGIARYRPNLRRALVFRMGQDPGVSCRAYAAWTLWLLGYPDQALTRSHDTLALAHELSHPSSLAYARCWAAIVSQFRRDMSAVHEQAETAVALSTEQGFPLGTALAGVYGGERARGIELL
jgi:predicted ATPase